MFAPAFGFEYKKISTPVIKAFPPMCAIFDAVVGLFVLLWWARLF